MLAVANQVMMVVIDIDQAFEKGHQSRLNRMLFASRESRDIVQD